MSDKTKSTPAAATESGAAPGMVTGNAGEVFPPVGPVLSGEFPLRWEHVSPLQLEQERNRANDSNEITLRNYYLLDERIQEPSDDRDESAPELVRIEQRLNLVIELLGQVLAHSLDLPAAVSCILSRASFEWSSYDVPTVGECVRLTLYLHPHYPKPLVLFGQVTHVVRSETTSRATAQLAQLSDAVGDWLDRLIFRAHRRRIALTRREKSR